mgnify:CR=1 FL=1
MQNLYTSFTKPEFKPTLGTIEPKVLRQVDAAAARNTVAATLVSLVVFALIAWGSGLYQSADNLVMAYGIALVALAGLRLYVSLRFKTLYGAGPQRWRQWFAMGLLGSGLLWSSFAAWLAHVMPLSFGFLLVIIYILGVATALAGAWLWGLGYRLAYLWVLIAPLCFVLLLSFQWQQQVLAVLVLVYGAYLTRLYRYFYLMFWHAVARQRRHAWQQSQHHHLGHSTQMQLLSRVSQDLKSPLNSVLGMLELLYDTPLDTEQKEYHLVAAQSARLMLMQLENVQDYSQIMLGHIRFAPDDFLLRTQLEQSLDAYGSIAQRQGLELSGVLDSRLPRRVRGDQRRIVQVINGLLSHAIKDADEGEVRVDVTFDEESYQGGTLSFIISSQGTGMSDEQVEQLFGETWDVEMLDDASLRSNFNLLVCRGLVDAMGGSLFVGTLSSAANDEHRELPAPQYNTQIGFRLPLPARPDMSERSEWRRYLREKHVVLVGMALGTHDALAMELNSLDIHTHAVAQYDDALQELRDAAREENHRDMIIIDLWQHKGHALRLCDTILNDPSLQGCKILLLGSTEQVGLESVIQWAEYETVQVLAKPVHRSGIRRVLANSYGLQSLLLEDEEFDRTQEALEPRKGYRLLLLEDNEADLAVTKSMLTRLGYPVKAVSELEKAQEILMKEPMHLVLTELSIEGRSVLDWVRDLRLAEEESQAPRLPVVALTAETTEGIQPKCLAAGLDDYLAKPITLDALDGALRYWLPVLREQQ